MAKSTSSSIRSDCPLRWAWGGGVLLVALLASATPAFADARVWEEEAEEGKAPNRYLDLTAFAQPGYLFRITSSDDERFAGRTDSTPWLQRARLGMRAQIEPWLRFRTELEMAPTPVLQDAFFHIVLYDFLQFQLGQFQVPFLRAYQFNELNLGFLDRPIYTPLSGERSFLRYLSPRDIGAMVLGFVGDTDTSSYEPVFEYRLSAALGRGANAPRNNDNALLYALRLQLHLFGLAEGEEAESDIARNPYPKAAVGVAGYSNCDDRANWNRGFTLDGEFRWQGLYASGAFVWFRNGETSSVGEALGYEKKFCGGSQDAAGNPLEFVSRGVHTQLQYLLPRQVFAVPGQDLEVLARFDWVDPNSPYDSGNPFFGGGQGDAGYSTPSNYDDSDNAPTQYRLTFGLNWFPTGRQTLRLSMNYQHNREAEDIQTAEGFVVGITNDILWFQLTAGI
ncbi:MAG: hypothetical protein KC416_01685 [Myxococcales bacterium]|nr:hypothetical protein [Myxococcales bacterium]